MQSTTHSPVPERRAPRAPGRYLLPFLFTASELATLDRDEDSAAAEDERPSAMVDIVDEVSSSEKYDLVGSPGNPLD